MEDFILGLLMPTKNTAYELHQIIKQSYGSICSHSIGNIQRALKILHKKGFVHRNEASEGKVVKKIYEITTSGRKRFMQWLGEPLDIKKARNMELGKLLMLGFLPAEQRLATIDGQIHALREELDYLKAVKLAVENLEAQHKTVADMRKTFIENNEEYIEEMAKSAGASDVMALIYDVNKFGQYTLKYGLAHVQFSLEWFEKLRSEIN